MALSLLVILGQGKDEGQSKSVLKLPKSRKSRDCVNVNLFLWNNYFAFQLPLPHPILFSKMVCEYMVERGMACIRGGGESGSLSLLCILRILPALYSSVVTWCALH